MEKNLERAKDVVAPKVKTIEDHIAEYLVGIGFKTYGFTDQHEVFAKPVSEVAANALYFLIKGAYVFMYYGFRKPNNNPDSQSKYTIRAKQLCACKAVDLEDTVALLAEQNYL